MARMASRDRMPTWRVQELYPRSAVARAGLLATILASSFLAAAALAPVGASAASTSLGTVQVGVPVNAPTPAAGVTPETTYAWQRCSYWSTLAEYDGTDQVLLLDDPGRSAANAANIHPAGSYVGSHTLASDGPLTGQGGPGSHFDGLSSALSIPEAPDPGVGMPYSVELWARPAVVDGTYRYLYSRERTMNGVRQGTGIWLSHAGLGFERWIGGHGSFITYAPGLPVGKWSQVVASFDGTNMRLYVNGAQVGSRKAPGLVGRLTQPSYVGAGALGRSGFFSGDLADVVLYIDAVPRAHVASQYADATTSPCVTIADVTASRYTPTIEDLGRTLMATVTTPSPSGPSTVTAQNREPVMDGPHSAAVSTGLINDLDGGQTVSGAFPVTATLFGLPAGQVSFEVDGEVGYAKAGEPPYQYLWNTAAVPNGPHVVSLTVQGPDGNGGSTTTQVTVEVEN